MVGVSSKQSGASRPPHRSKRFAAYFDHEQAILGTLVVVLSLVFWEGLTRGWWATLLQAPLGSAAAEWRVKPVLISSPTRVLAAAYRLFFVSGAIWNDLWVSGMEYFLGLSAAIIVGVPLGFAAGWFRRFGYALDPFLSAANATPLVAFLPLIIVWVGIGLWSRLTIIFLLAVIPISMSAIAGVKTVDSRLLRVAESFGSSEWHTFRSLAIPSCLPFLLAGLRLAVGRAMVGIVVGELFAATAGIGFMINVAGSTFQTDTVFVGVVVIALVGALLTNVIQRIERRLDAWRPSSGPAR